VAHFRKKPVVIEAWQWTFTPEGPLPPTWMNDALGKWPGVGGAAFWPHGNPIFDNEWVEAPHIEIITLEGAMRARPGDWIIKGVKGELYPCRADIFAATYDEAQDSETTPGCITEQTL
jgi:hypothetical protein